MLVPEIEHIQNFARFSAAAWHARKLYICSSSAMDMRHMGFCDLPTNVSSNLVSIAK